MKEKTNSRLHHSDKNFVLLQIVSVDKKKKIEKKKIIHSSDFRSLNNSLH